eukprot:5315513-Pyramimonas_sp.AAC.1
MIWHSRRGLLEHLGCLWGSLGASWGFLRGPSWDLSGTPGRPLGPSWRRSVRQEGGINERPPPGDQNDAKTIIKQMFWVSSPR